MNRIPTRITGVELLREATSRRVDGSRIITQYNDLQPQRSEQIVEADYGFTQELSYARRLPLPRTFRCLEGEVFVAVADIRRGSPTFMHWQGFYLSESDARTLSIPAGVACGWQVTAAVARFEVRADSDLNSDDWRWLRWNDLELAIAWPEVPETLARHVRPARSMSTLPDRALPLYAPKPPNSNRTRHSTGAPQVNQPAKVSAAHIASVSNRPSTGSARNADTSHQAGTATERPLAPQAILTPTLKPREELILVIGSSGQLGRDLCRHLAGLGTVVGACRQPERGSLLPIPVQVDVSRPASIRQVIRAVKPTLIVNASGLTDLEAAEREPRLAQLVNATAPSVLAEEALHIGSSIVHFCSDMVYDGSGDRPWRENDPPHPINQYGRTKLLGTEAIRNSGVPHLILRSGWMYSPHGNNYVTQLVDLLTYRNSIELANDHLGTPTSTDWLAAMTLSLLQRGAPTITEWLRAEGGLFHIAPLGYASRVEVGDQIVAACRALALPIVSNKFRALPLRSLTRSYAVPANCQLDCSKLAIHFGFQLPRWQQQLCECVGELLTHASVPLQHVA